MSVETVTVKLPLNYRLRADEERTIMQGGPGVPAQSLEEWRRKLSDRLISYAVERMYGETVPRKEQKIWRGIQDALADEVPEIELNATEFEWLCDLFLSARSVEKVQFPALWGNWSEQWMAYLEELQAARKAVTNPG